LCHASTNAARARFCYIANSLAIIVLKEHIPSYKSVLFRSLVKFLQQLIDFTFSRAMNKRSQIPWKILKKISSSFSTSLYLLTLNLISLFLYEIISLLYSLGVIKNKDLFISSKSGKFKKFHQHQRLIHQSIRRKTDWEMRRTFVCAPEMTPTNDCGALLLGVVIIFYLHKKKLKFHGNSIERSTILARLVHN